MIHYVFSVMNLVTGRIYIGKHSTRKIDDQYLGSGYGISAAVKKYGKENFERTIISFHETAQEAFDAEHELVTDEIVSDDRFYNLTKGGAGCKGEHRLREETRRKMSDSAKKRRWSPEVRAKMRATYHANFHLRFRKAHTT